MFIIVTMTTKVPNLKEAVILTKTTTCLQP